VEHKEEVNLVGNEQEEKELARAQQEGRWKVRSGRGGVGGGWEWEEIGAEEMWGVEEMYI